ncbi:hypothetical protein B0T22DRAFT_299160 [Podospora appendiculata]|uniref:Uncharacterized protein n=1 Tax=Podospora appendiculata TaxID=314037 RepID=A0AAE1C7K0_9PEZI|nr:hypothetical protein B0T22DRAFT_299160 [Podospora appendiculata]
MANRIFECVRLVEDGLPDEFSNVDPTIISESAERVVNGWPVSLWAQHTGTGSKIVNLRLPRILAFLKRHAQNGVGPAAVFDGVRYKFVHKDKSATTSEASSL